MATLFGVVMLTHQVGGFLGAWLGGAAQQMGLQQPRHRRQQRAAADERRQPGKARHHDPEVRRCRPWPDIHWSRSSARTGS
jgi:hypothetical protein